MNKEQERIIELEDAIKAFIDAWDESDGFPDLEDYEKLERLVQ